MRPANIISKINDGPIMNYTDDRILIIAIKELEMA